MIRLAMIAALGATPAAAQSSRPASGGSSAAPTLSNNILQSDQCEPPAGAGVTSSTFAINVFLPWRDRVCSLLRMSKWAATLDDIDQAREIMCADPDWRAAAKRVGRPCLADEGAAP